MGGILKNGLKIAPPEAPVTGYMFGKGVYFADACSKSAHYCDIGSFSRPNSDEQSSSSKKKEEKEEIEDVSNQRFLFLADVALGNVHDLLNADYKAPETCKKQKCDTIKGIGRWRYTK